MLNQDQFLLRVALSLLVSVGMASQATYGKSPQQQVPIAANFYRIHGDSQQDPPELPLWPSEQIKLIEVDETFDDYGKGVLNRFVKGIRIPTVSVHQVKNPQAAIVICPGGGYTGLSVDKEGHDTARWLNSIGITAVVLKYRCREYGFPAPMDDVQRAIAWLRSQASEIGFPSNRVGVLGYSAGGHVASTAGTHILDINIDGLQVDSRPDFMVLIYPVISMDSSITHLGSRENLLGKKPSDELVHQCSNELHVSESTPPTFLVHAADDKAVPIENSMRMLRALESAGVSAELALYQQGGHGFGLGSNEGMVASWPGQCEKWLVRQGIINQATAQLKKSDISAQ